MVEKKGMRFMVGRKILIMLTPNWSMELKADEKGTLADKINTYIGNTGNLMFANGCKYIGSINGNTCDFYDWYKMRDDAAHYKQEINEMYDLVIYPMANILQCNVEFVQNVINILNGITIPIYCLGIGISCNEDFKLDELCKLIREPVMELVRLVDASGGAFACRGYITQEVLAKIWGGDSEGRVVATGCPSMYQNGILNVEKSQNLELRIAINGRNKDFKEKFIRKVLSDPNAVYIDQDEYCHALYGGGVDFDFLVKRSYFGTKLLSEGRMKLFYCLPTWYSYVENNVDFMFGSRIHGNLIALLAGKPAMVYLPSNADLRVRELAEFFEVPVTRKTNADLRDLYERADYTAFNSNFKNRYDDFEKFLIDNNICTGLVRNQNELLTRPEYDMQPETLNTDAIKQEIEQLGRVKRKIYEWRENYIQQ